MKVIKFTVLIGITLVLTALAGCIKTDDPVEATDTQNEPPERSQEVQTTATTGSIKGEVFNINLDPVVGARVTIIETIGTEDEKEALVAQDGTFVLNAVAPGTFTIWVEALLHNPGRQSVAVKAGEVSSVSFMLEAIPDPTRPYVDQKEYAGKVGWAVAWQVEGPAGCIVGPDNAVITPKTCGGLRSGSSTNGEVKLEVPSRAHAVFAAMTWDPAGPLGENLQLDLMCPEVPRGNNGAVLDIEHPCYFDTPGRQSPLIHRVDKEHWETAGYNHTGNWSARVFATHGMAGTYDATKIDVGAAYEQAFYIYTEVWVNQTPPVDHVPLPDA